MELLAHVPDEQKMAAARYVLAQNALQRQALEAFIQQGEGQQELPTEGDEEQEEQGVGEDVPCLFGE